MGGYAFLQIKLMFQKILRILEIIDSKLSSMREDLKLPAAAVRHVYISVGLEKTLDALKTLGGSATSAEVAAITGRARAVESLHLNELWRNGTVLKRQRGRAKVFMLKEVVE